jgi:hypothetical protein
LSLRYSSSECMYCTLASGVLKRGLPIPCR